MGDIVQIIGVFVALWGLFFLIAFSILLLVEIVRGSDD